MKSTVGEEVLFISTRSPWSSSAAAAGADLLMTAAVFEQPVRVVFSGDGVWQLLADQNGDALKMKTLSRIFPAFELYDIRNICASESALRERALTLADLVTDIAAITDEEIRALIAGSKAVFVF
jgi:tRNA 2-thiouridine synthesizing protein C